MIRFVTAFGLVLIVATAVSGCIIVIGEDDETDAHWVVDYDKRAPQRSKDHNSGARSSPADQALLGDLQAKLANDAALSGAPILVAAREGVVTLRGEVSSAAALERAVRIVTESPGVDTVVMKMVLMPSH